MCRACSASIYKNLTAPSGSFRNGTSLKGPFFCSSGMRSFSNRTACGGGGCKDHSDDIANPCRRAPPPQTAREPCRGSSRTSGCLPEEAERDEMRDSGVRGSLSKVIDSLAAGYPFSIVDLLEFENRRRILF
jgi:hypothetical protein